MRTNFIHETDGDRQGPSTGKMPFYFLLSTFYFLLSTFYFILPLTAPQTSAKGLGPPAPLTLVHKNLQVKTLHPNEIDRL